MTHIEIDRMKVKAWKNNAKGKGIRWRMLRDLIATISTSWLNSYQVETSMIRLWGTKRKSTREMLNELVGMGDVLQEKDIQSPYEMKYYMNQERVGFWFPLGGLKAIPAGIAEAVKISMNARLSEG